MTDYLGRRRHRWVAVAVAAALLGACTIPGEERVAAVEVTPTAKPGGKLAVGTTPPSGIDPAFAHDRSGALVASTLCMTLVVLDPISGELRPGLAESWVVADRGASVLFKLRRGVTFTDGTPVDSRAVVETFRRLVNPDTGSYLADLLAPIAGFEEFRRNVELGDLSPTAFRGARVNEPYSFELLFNGNHPDFVRTLTHPATAPISYKAALADPVAFARRPVCAGGYQLAEPFAPGDTELHLERAGDHGLVVPSLTRNASGWADSIDFRIYPDAAAVTSAYDRGEVDVAPLADGTAPVSGEDIVKGRGLQVEYLGLPFGQTSLFNDVPIRQALSAAIDRRRIAEEVYGSTRDPATGFIPPVVGEAFRPDACPFTDPPAPASADAVREALGAGPVRIVFNDEYKHRQLVDAVAAMWREAFGVVVEPAAVNWDVYLQQATTGSGFDSAFRVSWSPKVASALDYIEPLFGSAAIGNSNLERYRSAEVDDVLRKEVRPATEEGDRIVKLRQIEDRLCRELPLLPLVFSRNDTAIRSSRVASARADAAVIGATGQPLLADLWVRAG